jgi:RNA polymerase sigma factor (TIGR02999 family)
MIGSGDITQILSRVREGLPGASEELFARVYTELKHVAARRMRMERVNHTLEATALVHEVYVRLKTGTEQSFENRARFFGVAVLLMREILIDHARRKRAEKRGGDIVMVGLDDVQIASIGTADELLDLTEALEKLTVLAPRQARVVELRYFGNLSIDEIAAMLEIEPRTVSRDWRAAREWLRESLGQSSLNKL